MTAATPDVDHISPTIDEITANRESLGGAQARWVARGPGRH